ncbi:conjugal transfer protein TraL, partial [Neisseria gonorrhoeae]
MAIIHISLQAKGGVGKSFLALMLSMFYRHIERPVKIFDTDPANATLFGFPALEAEKFEIMKKDDIDKRLFDRLFSQILSATDDVIIDVGANAFIPLCSYIISNNLITMLTQEGHQVIIHTSIVG